MRSKWVTKWVANAGKHNIEKTNLSCTVYHVPVTSLVKKMV